MIPVNFMETIYNGRTLFFKKSVSNLTSDSPIFVKVVYLYRTTEEF